MSSRPQPEALANYHCEVGENPLWDDERQLVYWTDIPKGRLFRYDVRTGRHEQFYSGEPVGGFTIQTDGSLLLFRVNNMARLTADGRVEVLVNNIDAEMDRFNDVAADPEGRVFAGTIVSDDKRAGLFRVDLDGSFTLLFKGTGCSNGMGFSPDLKTFYWTCTTTGRIYGFDYHRATGEISNRRVVVQVPPNAGYADGMSVDSEGNIWSARWDGFALYKYSPAGKEIDRIQFPVGKVSSVVFGGANLDEMYVTTAGGKDGSDTADGTLYRLRSPVRGLPKFRSRVLLTR